MIRNLVFISTWFRGKVVSLPDLLTMDIGYVSTLNRIAYEQSIDRAAMEAKKAQEVEDAIVDQA